MTKDLVDIIVAGASFVDHNKFISHFPEKGMLANIDEIKNHVGGCVSNTSLAIKKIDRDTKVKVYTSLGNDADGRLISNELKTNHIDITGITYKDDSHTGFTDVYTDTSDGTRTFFTYNGANDSLSKEDILPLNCRPEIFHIGYIFLMKKLDALNTKYGTNLAELLKNIQDEGIKTSIDLVSKKTTRFKEVVLPALKYCNYIIINELEGSMITDIEVFDENHNFIEESIPKILRKILDLGVRDVAVIHSPFGGWAMDKNHNLFYSPSFDLPKEDIRSSVGAGDAFCAGMLYSLSNHFDLDESLDIANAAAASSLMEADSVSGIKSIDQLRHTITRRKQANYAN